MKDEQVSTKDFFQRCPVPPEALLQRIVLSCIHRNSFSQQEKDELDPVSICFEAQQAFFSLDSQRLHPAKAASRLLISLLQKIAWRKVGKAKQQLFGKPKANMCQWFVGVRGTGSFCTKQTPRVRLDAPNECPSRHCYAPFSEVLEEGAVLEAKQEDNRMYVLEKQQIHRELSKFLKSSPILGSLFCDVMETSKNEHPLLKKQWAADYQVSVRTIENWIHRSFALFMVLYTGCLQRLEKQEKAFFDVIMERDFHHAHPLPNKLRPFSQMASLGRASVKEKKRVYKDAWSWLQQSMIEEGYPEAKHLSLPSKDVS